MSELYLYQHRKAIGHRLYAIDRDSSCVDCGCGEIVDWGWLDKVR